MMLNVTTVLFALHPEQMGECKMKTRQVTANRNKKEKYVLFFLEMTTLSLANFIILRFMTINLNNHRYFASEL